MLPLITTNKQCSKSNKLSYNFYLGSRGDTKYKLGTITNTNKKHKTLSHFNQKKNEELVSVFSK